MVVTARRAQALEAVVAEITAAGGRAAALAGDVRDEKFAAGAVALAEERFGGLDIALNNAATMGELGPVTQMTSGPLAGGHGHERGKCLPRRQIPDPRDAETWRRLVDLHVVVRRPLRQFSGMAAYAASKAALIGLTQTLATEYGRQALRVNALRPGATDTPMGRSFANTPEIYNFICGLQRPGSVRRSLRSALWR